MLPRTSFVVLLASSLLSADTLIFHNGSRLEGKYAGGDSQTVRFALGGQVNTYNLSDVDSLRFTGSSAGVAQSSPAPAAYPDAAQPINPAAGAPPQNASAPLPPNAPPPVSTGVAQSSAPDPAPAAPGSIQIPAGTALVVRLIDPVNSDQNRLGQTFRASLDEPVIVNGQTVIPRGADAVAALIDLQQSGKIQGRTSLTLDLKTVTVNGQTYDVVTTGVPSVSSSRGKRSAEVIGGTAALGAVIGALAGGGKGAAIGATSGAAVGTAGQVFTSGQKVKIPSETRLSFTLQNPLNL